MSTSPTLTTGQVMDAAAALMNDAAKSIYSYPIQVPYLNLALQDLQELFELNNLPVTSTVSAVISDIPAGTDHLAFGVSNPKLPDDFIEAKELWERPTGTNPYIPMTLVEILPRYDDGIEIPQFVWYTWQANEIRFLPANQNNDIKMDYIRSLFSILPSGNDGSTALNIINGYGYLSYHTAALLAYFIAENPTRAQELDGFAGAALDRITGISNKGRQSIMTRRRPFRAGYKARSNF